jgi:hypothetical protein
MKKLTWPGPWARLAAAAGGVDRLGVMLAVKRRQLARWALDESKPRGQAEMLIITLSRTLGVRSPVGESDAHDRTGVLFPTFDNTTIHTRFSSAVRAPEMAAHLDRLAAADVAARNELQRESRKRRKRKSAKRTARSAEGAKRRASESPVSKSTHPTKRPTVRKTKSGHSAP